MIDKTASNIAVMDGPSHSGSPVPPHRSSEGVTVNDGLGTVGDPAQDRGIYVDNPGQTEWTYQAGGSSPVAPEHRIEAEARVMTGWLEEERVSLWR